MKKMINKSKLAFIAAVALASIASPAFAQAATAASHPHLYAPDRPVYNYAPNAGAVPNPVDNPATTGGGSMGYNACAGHARC